MSPADAHPPTHVLAELAEGVLDDTQEPEVRAHVDRCLACQTSLDELAQVTVALRGLPAERPIPEFVAARISHALAAERASGVPASADGADGGTVAWFRRRLPQGLAAAASIAVVGLAGYVVVSGGAGGSGNDSAGDGAGVAVGTVPESPSSMGQRNAPVQTDDVYGEQDLESGLDSAELQAAVEAVVQRSTTVSDTCGQTLSSELGMALVGTDTVGAGVLVVLDGGDSYDGWLLSTCNSLSAEELEPHVEVQKPE